MNGLYLENEGTVAGPYPVAQVRELIQSGAITTTHLASIQPEGPWESVSKFDLGGVPAPSSAAMTAMPATAATTDPSAPVEHQSPVSVFMDGVIDRCLGFFWKGDQSALRFQAYLNFMTRLGQYGLLACAISMFFVSGVLAAKTNSFVPMVSGVVFACLMLIGHYLTVKFSGANRELMHFEVAHLGSDAIPSSLAFFFFVVSIVTLLWGLLIAFFLFFQNMASGIWAVIEALQSAIVVLNITLLCRQCRILLKIDPSPAAVPAGQVLLGLLKFGARISLVLSLIWFGVASACAAMGLFGSGLFLVFSTHAPAPQTAAAPPDFATAEAAIAQGTGTSGFWMDPFTLFSADLTIGVILALWAIAIPILAYFVYVVAVFLVDVVASFLRTAQNTERIP